MLTQKLAYSRLSVDDAICQILLMRAAIEAQAALTWREPE